MATPTVPTVSRGQVLRFRWRAHQLDTPPDTCPAADPALLDLGLQDTGVGGAAWALSLRGAAEPGVDELALAWTVRAAPHLYRRADLAAVAVATAPLSEADAAKRIHDASKPLKAAGIPALEALTTVAGAERSLVTEQMVKGDLSARLSGILDDPYLRHCQPCAATHPWEMTFRLAALQAGLELEPDTSPPVLRRIPDLEPPLLAALGGQAPARLNVVRSYLRFFAPARVRDVAAFLDAPVKDVKANWPADAVEVAPDLPAKGRVEPRFALPVDVDALTERCEAPGTLRLLGPHDPYLQLRDRDTLVSDPARVKDLWRPLGRPGAVAVDGEVVGTWRPRASGGRLSIAADLWEPVPPRLRGALQEQAGRFAAFRGLTLTGVST
jgi:hypothetical protein